MAVREAQMGQQTGAQTCLNAEESDKPVRTVEQTKIWSSSICAKWPQIAARGNSAPVHPDKILKT